MNRNYLIFSAMGFELVGIIIAFLYLGRYLDRQYQLTGMGTAGCLIFGMIAWFVHILWHLHRLEKAESESKDE